MFRSYFVNQTSYLHRVHPFLDGFSTKVAVSGTQSTGQEVVKRALDTRRIPRELAEGSHPTSVTSYKQTRPYPTVHEQLSASPLKKGKWIEPTSSSEPPNISSPNSHPHERVQFQRIRQFARLQQPIELTRDTSSGSSTQNSSGDKANVAESSLPIYSFTEYKDVPAVVYTKSESEANNLVQTLKG